MGYFSVNITFKKKDLGPPYGVLTKHNVKMQIVPISDHIVVQIEKDSEATLIRMKENNELLIKEPVRININCNHLESKLSMCCWISLIVGIIFIVVFFIAWGRFQESSQKYPPPSN